MQDTNLIFSDNTDMLPDNVAIYVTANQENCTTMRFDVWSGCGWRSKPRKAIGFDGRQKSRSHSWMEKLIHISPSLPRRIFWDEKYIFFRFEQLSVQTFNDDNGAF